jgi:hypothetical protein
MGLGNSISRASDYCRRHGLRSTIRRTAQAGWRTIFSGSKVVFYCDLDERTLRSANSAGPFGVEQIKALGELSGDDFKTMTSFWNPKLANRNIQERFGKGASLWLIRSENQLAGYGWTLRAQTIEPYYFPLGSNDFHFFDFHVFPQFRGRGVNPFLVGRILDRLATSCGGRAFIEAAVWNDSQLASLRKTPFRRLGRARSFAIFGHTLVSWKKADAMALLSESAEPAGRIPGTARSNQL